MNIYILNIYKIKQLIQSTSNRPKIEVKNI